MYFAFAYATGLYRKREQTLIPLSASRALIPTMVSKALTRLLELGLRRLVA